MDNESDPNTHMSLCRTVLRTLPPFDVAVKKSISTQTQHKCTKENATQTITQIYHADNVPICKICYQSIEDRMCYYTYDGDFCSKWCLNKHRDRSADIETTKHLQGISYIPYECVNCKSIYPFRIIRFEGAEYCSDKCLVDFSCKKVSLNLKNDHQVEMSRLCTIILFGSMSFGIILFIWKKLKN